MLLCTFMRSALPESHTVLALYRGQKKTRSRQVVTPAMGGSKTEPVTEVKLNVEIPHYSPPVNDIFDTLNSIAQFSTISFYSNFDDWTLVI